MREILFRGKRKFYGNWIEGMPTYDMNYLFKSEAWNSPDNYEVIPETVGQFTGMIDKNGVKIFEGDILHCIDNPTGIETGNYKVTFKNGCFKLKYTLEDWPKSWIEVIGNIHDNPELLK